MATVLVRKISETAGLRWNRLNSNGTEHNLKDVATVETPLTQNVIVLEEVRSRAAFVAGRYS